MRLSDGERRTMLMLLAQIDGDTHELDDLSKLADTHASSLTDIAKATRKRTARMRQILGVQP